MPTIVAEPTSESLRVGPPAPDPIPYIPRALPFDDPGWVFQPKYEGLRAFAVRAGSVCTIGAGRELRAERVRELADRVGWVLGGREAVFDGEIVALDREGRPSLRELLKGHLAGPRCLRPAVAGR